MGNTEKSMSLAKINEIRKSEKSSPEQIEKASGEYLDYAEKNLGSALKATIDSMSGTKTASTSDSLKEGIKNLREVGGSDTEIAKSVETIVETYLKGANNAGYREAIANQEKNDKINSFEPEELVQMFEGWKEGGVNPSDSASIRSGGIVETVGTTAIFSTIAFGMAGNGVTNNLTDKTTEKPENTKTELVTKNAQDPKHGIKEDKNGNPVLKADKQTHAKRLESSRKEQATRQPTP